MPKQIHEDFGEKIGGAKKDLWSVRGLYTDDLDEMNEREAEKYVKKDNIWKKPDYQAMLDDGVPIGVVYFMAWFITSKRCATRYLQRRDTTGSMIPRINTISKNSISQLSVSFKRSWRRFAMLRTRKPPLPSFM